MVDGLLEVPDDPKTSAFHSPAVWEKCYKWMDKHEGEANWLKRACKKWPGYAAPALKYRWKNRVLDEGRRGPEPRLTLEGEAAFKEWLEMQQDVGNCTYVDELGKHVRQWALDLGISKDVGGRRWMEGFFRRHPHLASRQAQLVEACRLTAMNPPAAQRFFKIAALALGVEDPAGMVPANRVYVMDECGVQATHLKRKHRVRAGYRALPRIHHLT